MTTHYNIEWPAFIISFIIGLLLWGIANVPLILESNPHKKVLE